MGSSNIDKYKFKKGDTRGKAAAGRKGGIASGQAKRAKKNMKQLAEIMLNSKAQGSAAKAARQFGEDLDDDELTNAAAIIAGQMISAIKGNTNAAKLVLELVNGDSSNQEEQDELTNSLKELAKSL